MMTGRYQREVDAVAAAVLWTMVQRAEEEVLHLEFITDACREHEYLQSRQGCLTVMAGTGDNEDAWFIHNGTELPSADNFGELLNTFADYALREDVNEALHRLTDEAGWTWADFNEAIVPAAQQGFQFSVNLDRARTDHKYLLRRLEHWQKRLSGGR